MNYIFASAGGLAFLTAFAFYNVVDAARWHEWGRLRISLAASLPLGVAACIALWIGIQHPTANFWWNQGFGSDWECSNLGRGLRKSALGTFLRASKQNRRCGPTDKIQIENSAEIRCDPRLAPASP